MGKRRDFYIVEDSKIGGKLEIDSVGEVLEDRKIIFYGLKYSRG